MKQYHEPIQVEVGDDGLPYSFRWRNRAWNVISVTDRWVLQAGWWRSDGTEKMSGIEDLAASIEQVGLLEPLPPRRHSRE